MFQLPSLFVSVDGK